MCLYIEMKADCYYYRQFVFIFYKSASTRSYLYGKFVFLWCCIEGEAALVLLRQVGPLVILHWRGCSQIISMESLSICCLILCRLHHGLFYMYDCPFGFLLRLLNGKCRLTCAIETFNTIFRMIFFLLDYVFTGLSEVCFNFHYISMKIWNILYIWSPLAKT